MINDAGRLTIEENLAPRKEKTATDSTRVEYDLPEK